MVDIGAGAKIYADGKFQDNGTASGNNADLSVTPQGGFPNIGTSQIIPIWMTISNVVWSNTGTHHKSWKESSAVSGLTNTYHTIGNLDAGKYYAVKVDNVLGQNITGTECSSGICKSDERGRIAFTYTGTYSDHTFDVEETTLVYELPATGTSTSRSNNALLYFLPASFILVFFLLKRSIKKMF